MSTYFPTKKGLKKRLNLSKILMHLELSVLFNFYSKKPKINRGEFINITSKSIEGGMLWLPKLKYKHI